MTVKAIMKLLNSNSQSDKDSSGSDDYDRYFKNNRRKRNNNIQPDGSDIDKINHLKILQKRLLSSHLTIK